MAILEGRFDDARALIEALGAVGDPNARLYAGVQDFVLAIVTGQVAGIDLDVLERETGRPAEYAYRAGYSWVLALAGDRDGALAQIAFAIEHLKDDMNRLAAIAELTQALGVLGEPGPAAQLYELLSPYAGRNIVNGRGAAGYGAASYHLGVLASLLDRDAEAHLVEAVADNRRLGAKAWLERSETRLAAMLASRAS